MTGPVLLLLGALAVFALLVLAGGLRHRALVRAPGAFPAQLVDADGRRRAVIGRYDAGRLCLTGRWTLGRELWSADRWSVGIERAPVDDAPGRALLRITDDGAPGSVPLALDVDEADAGAVRAWAEAGPSQAAHSWWRAPGQA